MALKTFGEHCPKAILVPLGQWYVKICVVPTETPFLLSNNMFRTLGALIDTASDRIHLAKLNLTMSLALTEKKLYLLDFGELVTRIFRQSHIAKVTPSSDNVLHTDALECPKSGSLDDRASELTSACVSDHHGRFDQQCSRALTGRSSQACDGDRIQDGRGGDLHEHVLPRTGQADHQLWRDQTGHVLREGDGDRSQVRHVVCQQVCQQREDPTQEVHPVHPTVCGTGRGDAHLHQSQSQSKADVNDLDADNHGSSSRVLGRGECSYGGISVGSPRRSTSADQSAGGIPDQSHRTDGECDEPHDEPDAGAPQCHADIDVPLPLSPSEQIPPTDLPEACALSHEVIDQEHVFDQVLEFQNPHNWVQHEMMEYWMKKHGIRNATDIHNHFRKPGIDLLEVYCSKDSQLTSQAQAQGLKAMRFGLQQGDLNVFSGRSALYDVLWTFRPKHVWASPNCGPWSSWNRLNAAKSRELEAQIQNNRKAENVHLLVCDNLLRLQVWRGPEYDFHLEQPQGSELVHQYEMHAMLKHTWRALCDMCVAGNLRHPNNHAALRKQTQVFSTSIIMRRMLEQQRCKKLHDHVPIEGSCRNGRANAPSR